MLLFEDPALEAPSFVFGARFANPRMALGTAHAPRACRIRCSPKGQKLGFEYLLTYKTLHCVRTACALRAHCVHGIPLVLDHGWCREVRGQLSWSLPPTMALFSGFLLAGGGGGLTADGG